ILSLYFMIHIRKCSKVSGVTSQTFSYPVDWAIEFGGAAIAVVAWTIYSQWIDNANNHIVIDEISLFEETGLHGDEIRAAFRALAEKGIIKEIETNPNTPETEF